jgi:hypothetical protein
MDKELTTTEEVVQVRGICATIAAMHTPKFHNLDELLRSFGYKLTKINNQQTQQPK